MEDQRQRLERALAEEVVARQELSHQLKELQRFVITVSQLACPEAREAALAGKAREIQQEWKFVHMTKVEDLQRRAQEEWAEELGLGPCELGLLPEVERQGGHLFVESIVTSPMKHDHAESRKKELIVGHA